MFRYALTHHIARKAVQMYRGEHGRESVLAVLTKHPRTHTRENVSRTTGGHSRIASGVGPGSAIGPHHQSAMPFEDNDQLVFACKLPRHSQPIFLYVSNARSRQPCHLS